MIAQLHHIYPQSNINALHFSEKSKIIYKFPKINRAKSKLLDRAYAIIAKSEKRKANETKRKTLMSYAHRECVARLL
jgi:hypothetical protein